MNPIFARTDEIKKGRNIEKRNIRLKNEERLLASEIE